MATGTLFPAPFFTALDSDGVTLSGALGYFYSAGTTTPLDTFSEVTLTTANANPVVTDAGGRFVAYLTPGLSYKFTLKTSAGTVVRTVDNIGAVPPSTVDLDVTATAGAAIAAGEVAYLSDGSGALTAGRWYLADADLVYGSLTCVIGIAPVAIASAASGSIRVGGRVTGLTGLAAGTNYYVSATGGALTATAPTNPRLVGTADTTTSLVLTANPGIATTLSRTFRVNASTPYSLAWPAADAAGVLQSSGAGVLALTTAPTLTGIAGSGLALAGGQIGFPATQAPSSDANTLDDYEEGSFTPSIGGSGGQSGQVYAVQVGRYVKIGKLVTASGRVQLSTLGTITTNVQIQGLPFAADATSGYRFAGMIGEYESFTTGYVSMWCEGVASATALTIYTTTAATTSNAVIAQANLSANTALTFSVTYMAGA